MGQLLIFAIASSLVILPAYAVYSVVQRDTTLYRFNRACLLSILCVGCVFGTMYAVSGFDLSERAGAVLAGRLSFMGVVADHISESEDVAVVMPLRGWIIAAYVAGVVCVGLWHAANLALVGWLVVRSRRYGLGRLCLAVHDRDGISPFSWGRWIVLHRDMLSGDREGLRMVVCHEATHLSRLHWADLLACAVAKTLMWFNPAVWLLSADLVDTHEYEADHAVTERYDASQYQMLLIKMTVGSRLQAMADSLNHSSLKKRITMMIKNPTNGRARWRALAMVPALALAVTVINVPAVASTLGVLYPASSMAEAPSAAKVTQKAPQEQESAGIQAPDVLPRYDGGEQKLYEDLREILKDAPKGLPAGRTVVNFEVDTEGRVTNPEVVRSHTPEFDKFVLENVVRLGRFSPGMQDGKPVVCKFTLPVNYRPE